MNNIFQGRTVCKLTNQQQFIPALSANIEYIMQTCR